MANGPSGQLRAVAFRLLPGQDLKKEIERYAAATHLEAGCVLSAVGSLNKVTLRYADDPHGTLVQRKLEIVSMTGTVSQHGCHLHLAVSTNQGTTLGGHLVEGSEVYTTVEVVLGILDDVVFTREPCSLSGYRELKVTPKKPVVP